jgi:hypothetical protein
MKQYEDKKFELWREQVETHLLSYLKRNLLTRSSTGSATTRSGGHTAKDDVGADDDHISPVHSKCFQKLLEGIRESNLQTLVYYTRKNLTTCQQDVFATGL